MNKTGPSNPQTARLLKEIAELEEQLAALKASLPAHSLSPAMFQKLDELEYEIKQKRAGVVSAKPQPDSQSDD